MHKHNVDVQYLEGGRCLAFRAGRRRLQLLGFHTVFGRLDPFPNPVENVLPAHTHAKRHIHTHHE